MQDNMLGSAMIQTKAAIIVRLQDGTAEVVKSRGGELEASVHRSPKLPGVRFLVLTPKE